MKTYTDEQKAYILSKITDMDWELIGDSLRDFWINWKLKNG